MLRYDHETSEPAFRVYPSLRPSLRGEEELFGQLIIKESARHGYRLNAGALYPLLDSRTGRSSRSIVCDAAWIEGTCRRANQSTRAFQRSDGASRRTLA